MRSAGTCVFSMLLVFGFGASTAVAVTLCATTDSLDTDCGDGSCWLEAALDVAATNNQDDVVRLVQGTFWAEDFDGFDYDSNQGDDLTVSGGWNAGCTNQTPDPTNTIIEGIASGTRMVLHNQAGGDILVRDVTVQNADWWNLFGLDVFTKVTGMGQTADVTIRNCIIQDNAGDGGLKVNTVVYDPGNLDAGSILIEDCIIRDNGGTSGGVVVSSGSVDGDTGAIDILDNEITGNNDTYFETITQNGVARSITIAGNMVTGNGPAGTGGGLEVRLTPGAGTAESVFVEHNQILDNVSNGGAGGLLVDAPASTSAGVSGGTVFVVNNIIAGNTASSHGGAIDLLSTGGGVAGDEGQRYVVNNTITGNEGGNWTETHGLLIRGRADSRIGVYNNIIWGNSPMAGGFDVRMWCDANTTTWVYDNDIDLMYTGGIVHQGGNINDDPDFVAPLADDYHLSPSSVCVDVGDNTAPAAPAVDIDGEDRPADGDGNGTVIIDMGADEYMLPALIFADGFEIGNTSRWSVTFP